MSTNWTNDQELAINERGNNILVAAAAGSGKTAVLVERIFRKITDNSNPVDIDKIVVVTFTRAAAAEMKDRLRKKLEDAAMKSECKERERIFEQMSMLLDAPICTIDSFCLNLIKVYTEETDIEPGFRIADEAEIELLKSEVYKDVYEYFAEERKDELYIFCRKYGEGKTKDIKKAVSLLYGKAIGMPWPEKWLESIRNIYSEDNNQIKEYYIEIVKKELLIHAKKINEGVELILEDKALQPKIPFLRNVSNTLIQLSEEEDTDKFIHKFTRTEFGKIPQKKSKEPGDDNLGEIIGDIWKDVYSKFFKEKKPILENLASDEAELIREDLSENVNFLIDFVEEYHRCIQEEKKRRNIITFDDIGRMALDILCELDEEDNSVRKTEIAEGLSEKYDEILIDEYQDNSPLQELILSLVSNGRNRYMVGDVKQSIYGFRNTTPKNFMEKYDTYKKVDEEESEGKKIILGKNFRSREMVLKTVNDIFTPLMKKEFCNIEYDEDEALYKGLELPEAPEGIKSFCDETGNTEIAVIEEDNYQLPYDNEFRVQARFISRKISELMDEGYHVYDKDCGEYRPIRYSDIAIIASSAKKIAYDFEEVLTSHNIPVYVKSTVNYLDTYEIRQILEMLRIIDNPLQDIHFVGAMRSYFGGFNEDEIAEIRYIDNELPIYKAMQQLVADGVFEGIDENTIKRAQIFMSNYRKLKDMSMNASIHDLLWTIIYDMGYYDFIMSFEDADRRIANIEKLLNRAESFEGSSYNGIYQFLRFIEKIKISNIELGENSVVSENDNVVNIMTIHKSKGLEYPVVFFAEASGNVTSLELAEKFLLTEQFGVAINYINLDRLEKKDNVYREVAKYVIKQEGISEQMRKLYVALTRAREKLFIVGLMKRKDYDKYEKTLESLGNRGREFDYISTFNIKTYLDMILPQLIKRDNEAYKVKYIDSEERDLDEYTTDEEATDITRTVKDRLKFISRPYKYRKETEISPKYSVTNMDKLKGYIADETAETEQFEDTEDNSIFYYDKTEEEQNLSESEREVMLEATRIGTAYHAVMQFLDFEQADTAEKAEEQIDKLIAEDILTEEAKELVETEKFVNFAKSKLGKKAIEAEENGTLNREQEFMIGKNIDGIADMILLQGVVDMYIENDDGIILVDYKTDKVRKYKNPEDILRERHETQLRTYAEALEQLTGKEVKEIYVYSFDLNKEVEIEKL